ncbi:MAG: methyltransferase, FxLD system, partial [Candidatus Methylomirabilaceae bacterium]
MDSRSHADDTAARLQRLVEDLKRRGCIRTAGVEAAFRGVPRHLFVPGAPLDDVYGDKAIPTKRSADGAFISSSSQPAIMALMLEQLGLAPGQRVLEIGAGTGYNAALMAHIVGETGEVTTMDIDEDLVAGAREHLAAAGFDRVRVACGDGGLGHPEAAPYDRIILTVGAWDITPGWREQLKPGGRLLLPLSIKGPQMCVAFEQADGHLQSVSIEECGFMAMRGAFAGPGGYVQIGEIKLGVADPGRIDRDAIGEWLNGPLRDLPTGIRVRTSEAFGPLTQWLAFREPGYCSVAVPADAADRGLIPDLFRWSGASVAPRYALTVGVVGENALCMLMRSPEAARPE